MDKKFLAEQKIALLAEKERLEKKIKELKKFPDYGNTNEDNEQELTDFGNNMSMEDGLEYLIKKVNKALDAIDKGTYGICKECQEAIEQGRLAIMPYAEKCVACSKENK